MHSVGLHPVSVFVLDLEVLHSPKLMRHEWVQIVPGGLPTHETWPEISLLHQKHHMPRPVAPTRCGTFSMNLRVVHPSEACPVRWPRQRRR